MIKSDKWIRRMAESTGMIEPYEAGQIRLVDGKRIVSYGTSSYGYDIRCSREFKIFTNINSTIVDPKNFDEGSFVDFTAMCASSRRIRSRSRGRWNTFGFHGTCSRFASEKHVCPLRNHCQRNPLRARVGRLTSPSSSPTRRRSLPRSTPTRALPGDLLRVGRSLRDVVQGPWRQVPGTEGRDAPKI